MKTAIMIMVFFLLITAKIFSQTTYYVSSSQGNDSNSGTSEASPWQSITKVNSLTFTPGDKILFKRGDKWSGEQLLINHSGTASNQIEYTSYGSGVKPIITLIEEVSGWNNPGKWTQYSSNVWKITFPDSITTRQIRRMWFNGIEYARAKDLSSSNLDHLTPGQIETFGVNSKHRYHHDVGSNRLYVWTDGTNPALYYNSIEYPGKYTSTGTLEFVVDLRADYVTIDELDIRGGLYAPIELNGSDYIKITNCVLQMGQHAGIINGYSNTDKTTNNVEISHNRIETDRKIKTNWYDGTVEYAIAAMGSTSNWLIHDNYIKNWNFGFLAGGNEYGVSTYHEFYDNEVTAPDIEYSKGMQLGAMGSYPQGGYHKVYRNYLHNLTYGFQLGGGSGGSYDCNGIKFYYNIISNIKRAENEHGGASSGYGFEIFGTDLTYVFNNTLSDIHGMPIIIWDWTGTNYFNNNLVVEPNTGYSYITSIQDAGNSSSYYNNLFFKTGYSEGNIAQMISRGGYLTLSNFNAQSYAEDNLQHIGLQSNLVDTNNFTLPTGSIALNAGLNIYALIPEGFTDRLGNIVDRTNPSIGAIQSTSVSDLTAPRLISAELIDSAKLLLTFSEAMSLTGINSSTSYNFTNGILFSNAQLSANQTQITLNTSPHIYGQNYSIVVNSLKDLSGNIIQSSNNSANYQSTFNPPPTVGLNKLQIIGATASANIGVNFGPDKTIDGRYRSNGGDTCWAATPMPQWLIYDLGIAKQISKTRISFFDFQNGRIYTYNISVSNDLLSWTPIVQNATSSNQEWTVNNFNPVLARYIRLDLISNNQNNYAVVWETEIWEYTPSQTTIVNTKAYLQGCFNNTEMFTTLNDSSQIPANQPYNSSPWNYSGNESVIPPAGAVDWVLLELRSNVNSSSTISRRAAFIMNNGLIVDLDGINPVSFPLVPSGDYYIVIKHRNHLPIMSANKVSLSPNYTFYDFTSSQSKAYGNQPMALLSNQKYGMYSGDGDATSVINVMDYGIVGNNLFHTGYLQGDLDMNGTVNVLDYGKANQNLLKVSSVP